MCTDGHHHSHADGGEPRPLRVPTGPMSRRTFAQAGGGLLLAAGGVGAVTGTALSSDAAPGRGASRTSRITRGTHLVHADLHNHTLMSDGDGDPALAFDSMRAAGLDVAALTDHATISDTKVAIRPQP